MRTPVIAIFDIGKTNKKLLLFDEQYQVRQEWAVQFTETKDEDGFPCEPVELLTDWVKQQVSQLLADSRWDLRAINVAAYGASFVHLDQHGQVVAPLYNYLKPYPAALLERLYDSYGGESALSLQTAAPLKDSLNSGLQLYRLKHEQPSLFERISHSLHLPQYLSYVMSGRRVSDITSTGCHTGLWDFNEKAYHRWVTAEGIESKLAPLVPSHTCSAITMGNRQVKVGVGLHDSSSALIPYQRTVKTRFLQLSTGTWCVSLNPFNDTPLTGEEMSQDCLCYLSYEGNPVKASRLMLGKLHEQSVTALARQFEKPMNYFERVRCDLNLLTRDEPLSDYPDFETAYHHLVADLVQQQVLAAKRVLNGGPVSQILVDGGFSKNPIFMQLLVQAFPDLQVQAASVAQATAVGAAMCIHADWNEDPIPDLTWTP